MYRGVATTTGDAVPNRGRAARLQRHGLAVRFDRPLPKDKLVFLSMHSTDLHLDQVIGIVHNCFAQDDGYRCGIRFRTQSALQFDRELVEGALLEIESKLTQEVVTGSCRAAR